ncbi:TonB-dependent receptor [Zunongwangia sp. HRR-M8]|uniref:TonB-dependent receptor n=1 Tax=Zunongwangia sp. HRR-M8 TaxID=3015170 RepID=UPI0022DDCE97|nr:carboxypeptidase-like regulatory domain-containing protein [Zunongwangia sp. HRR-M8]WBL22514.1 carboxypeptidase-like regulatory domain-containing protein [Zunongwangia sp. HRR-M8]
MRKLITLLMLLFTVGIFAQGTITGTVIDSEMVGPLPGANVMVVGSKKGTTTDFDGNFSLDVNSSTGTLKISFVGYKSKQVQFSLSGGSQDLGDIILVGDDNALDEIVITSFSLAIDRKTPVAVSTVKAETIETKLGNQEFPEILKSTPGIYVTKQGGGFGDADIRMRGFNSENIAVMINGVPVNDMESGRVYWSNWAGLADVTKTMQTQRGLGAAKVAVPSIGGTINIVTKSTDAEMGGSVIASTGNDGLQKFGATVSTGKSENGWAATVSASKTSGRRFADGLEFEGYNYFLNIAKEINENHELSLTAFGAPQRHGQRETLHTIEDYKRSDRDIKFNGDWGYRNGQVVNVQDNFYHKPQISLNHYWDISDRTELSTAAYVSFGTGGGGGYTGNADLRSVDSDYRSAPYQPLNLDRVVDENAANGADGSQTILYDSRNDHFWTGLLSTVSTEVGEGWELLGGIDLRYYKGEHFQEVKDLLGGQYWADDSNVNDPNRLTRSGDKINYYNDGLVLWEGGFAQAEYSDDNISGFLSVSASNTSYKRKDYFQYSGDEKETDWINFFAYGAKGGANYNLDDNHNIFANVGYFERAPFFNTVFLNNKNIANEDAENQKIFSAELGYGFRTQNLRIDFNLYRTSWKDKTLARSFIQGNQQIFANILGVDALHQGVELEFQYKASERLNVTGMMSLGDWKWDNNVDNVDVLAEDGTTVLGTINVAIDGVEVGNSAQTTAALGLNYEAFPGTFIRGDFTYYDRYFADFDPTVRDSNDIPAPFELPDVGLLDLGLTHNFQFGSFEATLNANVFNVLDTQYISDAREGNVKDPDYNGLVDSNVWYGFGRTYSVGAKIKF